MFKKKKRYHFEWDAVEAHTGIFYVAPEDTQTEPYMWLVIYQGVEFARFQELKDAHERLQKLLALDTTR